MIQLHGIRTHCVTGAKRTVTLFLEKKYHESLKSWWWMIVDGGVTGFESFRVADTEELAETGWCACAGTKGRWDNLEIPAEEMRKLVKGEEE